MSVAGSVPHGGRVVLRKLLLMLKFTKKEGETLHIFCDFILLLEIGAPYLTGHYTSVKE